MSAFHLGRDAVDRPRLTEDDPKPGNSLVDIVGRVVKFIPGDVVVIFSAGIALYLANEDQPGKWLIPVGLIVAPLFVFAGAFSAAGGKTGWLTKLVRFRIVAAAIAFFIWSFTVPATPWNQWDFIEDNDIITIIAAAILGGLFSLFADGFERKYGGGT